LEQIQSVAVRLENNFLNNFYTNYDKYLKFEECAYSIMAQV